MRKIYISGPISGLPFDQVKQNFNEAEIRLQEQGYEVVNPLNNGLHPESAWREHLRADIRSLMGCDAIYLLKGYQDSKGAMIEYDLARILGYDIIEQIR